MIIDEQWECWMDPMRDKYDENVLKKLKAGTYRGEKGRHLLWTRLSPPLRVKNKSWAGGNRRDDKYIYIYMRLWQRLVIFSLETAHEKIAVHSPFGRKRKNQTRNTREVGCCCCDRSQRDSVPLQQKPNILLQRCFSYAMFDARLTSEHEDRKTTCMRSDLHMLRCWSPIDPRVQHVPRNHLILKMGK